MARTAMGSSKFMHLVSRKLLGDLEDLWNAKNDPQSMCLDFSGSGQSYQNAPAWTLPSYSTLRLLYVYLAVYVAAVIGAILFASCFSKRAAGSQTQAHGVSRRMGFISFLSAVLYFVDVVSDFWTISDMFRCGDRFKASGVSMLVYVFMPMVAWLITVGGYSPSGGLAGDKALLLMMPQGTLLLGTFTWCAPSALAPAAIEASSHLLHVMEAMLEAVPTSVLLWSLLHGMGQREAWRREFNLHNPGNPIPATLPPMRRFLWFFTMTSSCIRVVTGTFSWAKANKRATGSVWASGDKGLGDLGRHMDPPLSQIGLRRLFINICSAIGGVLLSAVVMAIVMRFVVRR